MVLGSHNSWSYAAPKQWYMRPFRFMAQCQDLNIVEQYELGVRCFDLRVRITKDGELNVVHGNMVYNISNDDLVEDLTFLNTVGDCYVRVIHDVRTKKQYNTSKTEAFIDLCKALEDGYSNIKFYCGENLYNRNKDYVFKNNPSCLELYSSVTGTKFDDLYPRLYAKKNNKKNIAAGTNREILMIDFVNIQ